jgi:beta-mannosidase
MIRRLLIPILAFFVLSAGSAQAQTRSRSTNPSNTRTPISTGWQFREAGKDKWFPASVPGCVHTDLLNNKLIDDPFYRDNEKKLQWIGKTDWEYQTIVNFTAGMLKRKNLELVFEGLDTYADVFLNDQLLITTDNMFRTWRVNIRGAAKLGTNTLRIHFRSPINEVLPVMAKMNYELPAANDQGEKTSPHTRKAPYQYGWDWGPRLVTSGIWRPVFLDAWDDARVSDLHIQTKEISADIANVTAEVEVIADANVDATIILDDLTDKKIAAQRRVNLTPGANHIALNINVPHPSP